MDSFHKELQELLREAIKAEGAFKGTVQKYDAANDHLEIVASEGFGADFLTHFKKAKPFDSSCCGRAFGAGRPVMINDVETDPSFQPNLHIAVKSGFRSVKSVPIYNQRGMKTGVISTHFMQARSNWDLSKLESLLPKFASILDELMLAQMS
jgi:hypothetical protein